jgi:hypothetical protein
MDWWALRTVLATCESEAKRLTAAKHNPLTLLKAKLTWAIINGWSLTTMKEHIQCEAPTIWSIFMAIAAAATTRAGRAWME